MLKLLAVVFGVYIGFLIWDIIILLFLALLFSSLIDPFANIFERKKIPRGLAVLVVYIVLIGLLGIVFSVLIPVVARDWPAITKNLEQVLQSVQSNQMVTNIFGDSIPWKETLANASRELGAAPAAFEQLFSTVSGFFRGLVSVVLVLVITFYMVVQDDPIKKILKSVLPDSYVPRVTSVIAKIRDKLTYWIRGQLILSVIIGVLVYIGLLIIGIEYAAVIALLAALFEFIPYIGPFLASLPAIFFGFLQGGPVTAIIVVALYVFIQQIENNILVPQVMRHAVGLNPIVSIIAILTGAQLAGVVGALVAIPVATAITVVVKDFLEFHKNSLEAESNSTEQKTNEPENLLE